MAKQLKLKAQVRAGAGRPVARKLRRQEIVPASICAKGEESQLVQVDKKEITKLLANATSEHVLVDLEIADGSKTTNRLALIQEVQHHALRRDVIHVDFHAVREDEKLHAAIPIEPVGEPNGVRNFGGVMDIAIHELDVECLPKDLPDIIRVDVTALNIGQSIHVRDLQLPAGVVAKANPDLTVIAVSAPRVEAEPVPAAEVVTQPEVIKEKKEEPKAEEKEKEKDKEKK
jgi:large subunit ribosomal protein L25